MLTTLSLHKTSFTKNCPAGNKHEQTIVLGCYHGNQAGIFVLAVSDPRLNGVEQVTTAHEMLHAAYDRLSSSEKKEIDSLLLDYYHNQLQDKRIRSTIDAYKKSEPDDLVNEMHSIFATEAPNLPPKLEKYYQRYFTNRAQVAAFAAQYLSVFSSRQTAISDIESQLAALKTEIDAGGADLKTQQSNITEQQAILLRNKSSGDIAAYNAGVPAYNRLIDTYNNQVASLKSLIIRFNGLVSRHNALVFATLTPLVKPV